MNQLGGGAKRNAQPRNQMCDDEKESDDENLVLGKCCDSQNPPTLRNMMRVVAHLVAFDVEN